MFFEKTFFCDEKLVSPVKILNKKRLWKTSRAAVNVGYFFLAGFFRGAAGALARGLGCETLKRSTWALRAGR